MNLEASEQGRKDDGHEPLLGLAALMRMIFSGVDLTPLATRLIERQTQHPDDANALMDLSTIVQLWMNRKLALATQAQALAMQQLYRLPAPKGDAGVRLLALMAPGDLMANTPLDLLLEDSDVALDMLYLSPDLPVPPALPDHDLLFVAVGESDQNRPLLKELETVMKSWPRPVLNRPERIVHLARDTVCTQLATAPGVVMPITVRIGRQALERIGRDELAMPGVIGDGDFPVIVRPIDSHAGQGLIKAEHPSAIADYLQTMTQDEFYVSRFVDYRGTDARFRKYRVVLIEGRPFACHMGISENWMIHYLNAGMHESADKRAEEERFMASFDEDFGRRHEQAFAAIDERIGLDYLVVDCAETHDGKLLVFELDSGAVVHALDPIDVFPYKRPQMQKVFSAFREMLAKAMTPSP